MSSLDKAERVTAWTWAARTLGIEVDPVRIAGLVEVTLRVPVADLREAIKLAMQSEPAGFLPNPGAVVEAYRSISEGRSRRRELPAPREMSREDHARWMAENNPEGWSDATWAAFVERLSTDPRFKALSDANFKKRHEWAAAEASREIGKRHVTHGFRIDLRRRLNAEAIDRFPRPHPTADGWVPAKDFDPIAGLARRMEGQQ